MSESESGAQGSLQSSPQSSQLSAMFDDALPAAECELLAKRLSADATLQRQWSRYALIGAALRSDPVAVRRNGDDVASRVAAALAGDAALPAEPVNAASMGLAQAAGAEVSAVTRWRRPLAATGIAAGVAALSLVWLQRVDVPAGASPGVAANVAPNIAPSAAAPAAVEVVTPAVANAALVADAGEVVLAPSGSSEPESYVVPALPASGAARPVASAQLANFVVAHSEFSGSLARRGMLSALVAGEAAPESAPSPAPAAAAAAAPSAAAAGSADEAQP